MRLFGCLIKSICGLTLNKLKQNFFCRNDPGQDLLNDAILSVPYMARKDLVIL